MVLVAGLIGTKGETTETNIRKIIDDLKRLLQDIMIVVTVNRLGVLPLRVIEVIDHRMEEDITLPTFATVRAGMSGPPPRVKEVAEPAL
jgi:hypothetical protein